MQRFAAVPSTCFTKKNDVGLHSAAFDCASEAVIRGRTKQHSRSISLLGAKQACIDLETLKAEIQTSRGVDAATLAQASHREREIRALLEAHVHSSPEHLSKKEVESRRGRSAQRFFDAHARTHGRRLESEADLHQCEHQAWSRTPRWKGLNSDERVIWHINVHAAQDGRRT